MQKHFGNALHPVNMHFQDGPVLTEVHNKPNNKPNLNTHIESWQDQI